METGAATHAGSNRSRAIAERDARACELRESGMTWKAIGAELGIDRSTACRIVKRALHAIVAPAADHLRQVECAKLDADDAALVKIISDPPPVVAGSGKVTDVPNVEAVSRAVDVRIRLAARRAKLLGLDAPVQRYITVSDERIEREAREMIALALAELGTQQSAPAAIDYTVEADWSSEKP